VNSRYKRNIASNAVEKMKERMIPNTIFCTGEKSYVFSSQILVKTAIIENFEG
jgi:hypothetical protein